jgi:hypothetical protein
MYVLQSESNIYYCLVYISLYDMFRPYTVVIVYISILPELFQISFSPNERYFTL